jgi:hypothetical protein
MSRANGSGNPNCVIRCEVFPGNHFNPPSEQFVSSKRMTGILSARGSRSRKHQPRHATRSCVMGLIHTDPWRYGARGDQARRMIFGGLRVEPDAQAFQANSISSHPEGSK